MFNSEDGYVLDFEAEEEMTQSPVFDVEDERTQSAVFDVEDIYSDCSTITASEVNSAGCNSPTPPLFCKLRKARVMIKKLPRDVLKKYNLKSKMPSKSPVRQPLRTSQRIGGKHIPPGLFLALHVNKPLSVVNNKKKRLNPHFLKTVKQETGIKKKHLFQNKKSVLPHKTGGSLKKSLLSAKVANKSYKNDSKPTRVIKSTTRSSSLTNRKQFQDKISAAKQKNILNRLHNPPDVYSNPKSSSTNRRSLHERIAYTRIKNNDWHLNKLVPTNLTNFRDVVITRYDMPHKNLEDNRHNSSIFSLKSSHPFVLNEPVNNSAMNSNYITNSIMVSTPHHNTNVQEPLPLSTTISNISHMQNSPPSNVFPTLITTAPNHHQATYQPMVLNSSANKTNDNLYHQANNSSSRMSTVQTFKVPHKLSARNNPVLVESPKVLVINEPSLRSDPLNMTSSSAKKKKACIRPKVDKEHNADTDIESCVESETELELSDTEKQTEPEVIKRIIYHTKSVQTKFTCNSSICGLIDSDEFNLNCFYCYDIFPLHKWLEFKEHIKLVHQVQEKENQIDSDSNSNFNLNARHDNGLKQNLKSPSKVINYRDIILNQKISRTNPENNTEHVFKKLPLDPRLVTQHQKKYIPDNVITSTPKTLINTTKQLNQSNTYFNSICTGDLITLDSDDDVIEMVSKNLQEGKKTTKTNWNNSVSRIDEAPKIILPTLPHITIKKVDKVLPNKSTNANKPAIESSCLQETFIKIPSNYNIQKVIKTQPKPTAQQLSANGHTRPRYFVVKKIIKMPTTDNAPNVNISKGMILTKTTESKTDNITNGKDSSSMPTNDESEDLVPKPTNGRGILIGVTNSMVVIEFLLKLKSFPELWRPQFKKVVTNSYNESLRKLCCHLNNRFDLNITDFEMRLSIQRVKDWYCYMLKNIHDHNKNHNNTEPYKHKFLLYFKILNQFLTSDVQLTNSFLPSSRLKSNENVFRLDEKSRKEKEIKPKPPSTDFTVPKPINMPSTTPLVPPTTRDTTETTEITAESVIEFDADTLYDNESSDEEVLEVFDETKTSKEKIIQIDRPKKKKSYIGNFECDVCHKTYKRIYELKSHKLKHFSLSDNKSSNEGVLEVFYPKKKRKSYGGNYECDICHKTYKRVYELQRHKIMHFPPEFECGVCSQKFYFKNWAAKCSHLRKKKYQRVEKTNEQDGTPQPKRVWPKKIFRFKMICEICGASYRSIGSLNTHKRDKHLNQRAKCVVCDFTALSNWRIVQHQKKRHIVEPGTLEEVAKKTRARTDTKTPFSNEARQEFDWRREMRKTVKPGEKLYACCKCRIVFNSRKERVLHNKIEHPVKETTVFCLLCLPNRLLLSNSNCARRHYTDIHKVPWHEIDDLVKRTKPIFDLLSNEEIELVKASENYKELLEILLKDKILEPFQKIETQDDEALEAIQNLPVIKEQQDKDVMKIDVDCTQEDNVYVDGIIDHDYNHEQVLSDHQYSNNNNEHNYSEGLETNETYHEVNNQSKNDLYSHHTYDEEIVHMGYDTDRDNFKTHNHDQGDQEYLQNTVEDFIEGELIEESIVVEECMDEVNVEEEKGEEEEYF